MFIISYAWKIRINSINYWLSFSSAFIQSEKALIIESAKFTGYTFTCLQELLNFHFSFDFLHFLPAISVSELACFFRFLFPRESRGSKQGRTCPQHSAAGHFFQLLAIFARSHLSSDPFYCLHTTLQFSDISLFPI